MAQKKFPNQNSSYSFSYSVSQNTDRQCWPYLGKVWTIWPITKIRILLQPNSVQTPYFQYYNPTFQNQAYLFSFPGFYGYMGEKPSSVGECSFHGSLEREEGKNWREFSYLAAAWYLQLGWPQWLCAAQSRNLAQWCCHSASPETHIS